jgi:hypothetical protein
MNGRIALGLGLALAASVALNWGFFTQHRAASEMPPLSLRRPLHSLGLLFTDRGWLSGYVVGLGGWGLYVAAVARTGDGGRRDRSARVARSMEGGETTAAA